MVICRFTNKKIVVPQLAIVHVRIDRCRRLVTLPNPCRPEIYWSWLGRMDCGDLAR